MLLPFFLFTFFLIRWPRSPSYICFAFLDSFCFGMTFTLFALPSVLTITILDSSFELCWVNDL